MNAELYSRPHATPFSKDMAWLVVGLLTWMIVHSMPSAVPDIRQGPVARLGERPNKRLFAISILIGLGFIVYGWRSTIPEIIYLSSVGYELLLMPLLGAD